MKFVDQMGHSLELNFPIRRIVSLVPSQTEFLHSLGLDEEVIGITKFCVHPKEWHKSKSRIGGTKNVDVTKVRALRPDIIIGNKEENCKENIDDLRSICPIWMSDITTLDDAYEMMLSIGEITSKVEKSKEIVFEIQENFRSIHKSTNTKKVLYFIWKKPWIAVGKNTFINHLLEQCGFINGVETNRYPQLSEENFPTVDYVFLSSEPFPFKNSDLRELKNLLPHTKILIVDGEYFSWYGSKLIDAPKYFEKLLTSLE